MFKSKRFLYSVVSLVAFLIGVLFFKLEPINFATGITILLTPYLAAQTFRGSTIKTNKDESTT